MMRSIRLILASLFIAVQLSGVQSQRGNGSRRKDQLRGGGRTKTENIKERNEESLSSKVFKDNTVSKDDTNAGKLGRDLQKVASDDYSDIMTWEDDIGFEAGGYDDYYALPGDVAYTGNAADDNFFTSYDNTDMGYNFDSVSDSQSNQYDNYYTQDDGVDDYFEMLTDGKGRYHVEPTHNNYYDYKYGKGGKSGKSKNDKKSGKDHHPRPKSGKYSKAYYSNHRNKHRNPKVKEAKASYRYDVPEYDDFTEMDDVFSFQPVDGQYYDDYYQSTSVGGQAVWSNTHDDFFDSSGSSNTRSYDGSNSQNNRQGSNQGRSSSTGSAMSYYDDDDDAFFRDDKPVYFIPRPLVVIEGSLYSENRARSDPSSSVVTPDNTNDSRTLGTEYLWAQTLEDALNINSNLIPISVDNEIVHFYFAIDGYCLRIGPPDQNSVQGYCFFTYTAIDPNTNLVSGSFTAQGIIVSAIVPGQLTVSGGTGIMTGAIGLVEILPADLDVNFFPPVLIQPQVNEDPFDQVAGWAHYFEISVDVLFFLPELYAPPRPN